MNARRDEQTKTATHQSADMCALRQPSTALDRQLQTIATEGRPVADALFGCDTPYRN
jgi:hypothetical protein